MNLTLRKYLAGASFAAALALAVAGCDLGVPTPTPAAPATSTTTAASTPTSVAQQPTATTEAGNLPTPTTSGGALPTPEVAEPGITPVMRAVVKFADYDLEPTSVNPSLQPYTVEPGLANVQNAGDFQLSDAARKLIEQNAFAAQFPSGEPYLQFYQLYEDGRYSEKPVFVTTDSLLHVYHLMFDKVLRTTETKYLIGDLHLLNAAMLGETQVQYNELKGTAAEDAARRNLAYFTVASRLLDPSAPIAPEVQAEVTQELKNIADHAGLTPSAVMNIGANPSDDPFLEDFGQYKPRGHYTRSPELEKYFQAMMWYGRMTFRLKSPSETQSALLLVNALQKATTAADRPAADVWANIYDPTAFFVGGSDDLTYRDYAPLAEQIYGDSPDLKTYADQAKLEQFRKAADALAAPRINSMFVWITEDKEQVTKGLRMMGQRFTLDAYIFGQLIWRNVGTNDPDPAHKRWLPKGLDIPAAFGSEEAYKVLDEMDEVNCPFRCVNYPEQMEKVRGEIAGLPNSQWTENLYWSWLYTFRPLLSTKAPDSGYPSFMTNQAWTRKNLNTVLGSWTELKHDTILYAKQVMAEAGGGPPEPTVGYVEPEPEFYARVAALVGMTRDGLVQRGLLETPKGEEVPADYKALQDLQDLALDLKHISEKELAGEELTADEYDLIKFYGAKLEGITRAAADPADEDQGFGGDLNDQDAAVVADVASEPGGNVLTEGTGRIMEVYVVFPVGGKLHIGRGGIYSQYEFVQPTSNRLTDEQWRQRLDQGQIPPIGDWKTYIAK
jgi:hypothetical protein